MSQGGTGGERGLQDVMQQDSKRCLTSSPRQDSRMQAAARTRYPKPAARRALKPPGLTWLGGGEGPGDPPPPGPWKQRVGEFCQTQG